MAEMQVILPIYIIMTGENWTALFVQQSGRGPIVHWEGFRPQRGAGIGGILRRIIKLVPAFAASPVGQTLINTGKSIFDDVRQGVDMKESLKKNARQAVRNMTGVGKQRGKGRVIGYIRGGPKKRKVAPKTLRRAFIPM